MPLPVIAGQTSPTQTTANQTAAAKATSTVNNNGTALNNSINTAPVGTGGQPNVNDGNPTFAAGSTVNGSVTPAGGATTPPAPVYTPQQISTLKSTIESTANAEGNNLSSVPTNSTSTAQPIDYTLHPGESLDAYNARISAAQTAGSNSSSSSTAAAPTEPGSSSPDLTSMLAAMGTQPAVPNLNADQTAEETAQGIPALNATITQTTQQIAQLQAQATAQSQAIAGKTGSSLSVINGQETYVDAKTKFAMDNLKANLAAAQTQLTQANTVVSAYMTNDRTNYTDAETQYENDIKDAISEATLANTEQDKLMTTAQANIALMVKSFTGSGKQLDPTTASQISSLETQAGYAPGTVQAMITAATGSGIKFGAPVRNTTTGQVYAMATPNDGSAPYLVQIGNVGSDNGGQLTTNQQTIINEMNTQLAATDESKSFSHIADVYDNVKNIDPTTTDPTQQAAIVMALAQMEVPGARTVRGALSAANSSDMNPGVWNLLNKVQKTVDNLGTVSPDNMKSITDLMNQIYNSEQTSYTNARNDIVQGAVARGIPGADTYITNYGDVGNSATSSAPTVGASVTADSASSLPDGTTATDASGTVWTIQGGQWTQQ